MNMFKWFVAFVLTMISLIAFYLFISLPFPHISNSTPRIILSIIIFAVTSLYIYQHLFSHQIMNLALFFNASWGISVSLALLSLSNVQYDLRYTFLFYLFLMVVAFNFGFYPSFKRVKNTGYQSQSSFRLHYFEHYIFKTSFFFVVSVCVAGYAYQIYSIGGLPILMAIEEGFFDNLAGYLSIIHYFSTSLGALAGVSLTYFIVSRSKFFYGIIFLVTFLLAASLLAKNILFLFVFFFVATLFKYKKIKLVTLLIMVCAFAAIMLVSSSVRTGSAEYMQTYSRIHYFGLPNFFYWINTYFAINVTHLGTYFYEGYTPSYGSKVIGNILSLTFIKDDIENIIGQPIVFYNGLGGNINVVPLFYNILTDFGGFSPFYMLVIGLLSGYLNSRYLYTEDFGYTILFAGFLYILGLSVFADYLHRLMVPISMFFTYFPFLVYKLLHRGMK